MNEMFNTDRDGLVVGKWRKVAESTIIKNHYSHCFPSGKSYIFKIRPALIVYSIPANKNLTRFVLGRDGCLWELSRLWAPDGHEPNLLTRVISKSIGLLQRVEPDIEALVSFADPNVGHLGGVYRAASWTYTGQSSKERYYRHRRTGQVVARRKFHSGQRCMTKAQIENMGYVEILLPGKHRFVKGLSRQAKRDIKQLWCGDD